MKATLSGVLAAAFACASPAMVLNHALHGSAPMPGMFASPLATGGAHHHLPADQAPGPLQPCCNLCVLGCTATTPGAPPAVVVVAQPLVHALAWVPAASLPSGRTAGRLLPPSIGPPARS